MKISKESNNKSDFKRLVELSIPPSLLVTCMGGYERWCRVNECLSCGILGHSDDMRRANPCPNCGNYPVKESFGRWVNLQPWWKMWGPEGYWEMLEQTR